jgi:hypothetical protein
MRSKISLNSANKHLSYPENLYLEKPDIQVAEGGALLYVDHKNN